jgi:hypothetical protein
MSKGKSADDTIRELIGEHTRAELVELIVAMSKPVDETCPPHNFRAASAWDGEQSMGFIYCRWCAEVRELAAPSIEAPAEETLVLREQEAP